MQPAVIVERLMLLVGATFLSVAFFQFRLNSASNLVGDYDENNEIAVRGRFAKLRPLPYIPPINRDYIDGTGIELVLGKKCLNLLPNSDVLDLQKCMFNPNQNFNWSEYQQLDIANETGHRLCVALSPANNQSLSLESCNKSLSHQKWDFTRISGRYKRYGKLQHLNTGLCLGRNWINVSSESLVVTPCSQPHLRSHMDCDEAWYLPRSHQTYFKKDAKPFALHAIPKNTPHPGGRWKPKQIPKPAGRVLCWVLTLPEAHDKRVI